METTAVIPAFLEMSETKHKDKKTESVVVVDLFLMPSSRLKSQPGLKPDVGMPKGGGGGWNGRWVEGGGGA